VRTTKVIRITELTVYIGKEQKSNLVSVKVSGLIGHGMGESTSLLASGAAMGRLSPTLLGVVF
jgi:hypothetical protein